MSVKINWKNDEIRILKFVDVPRNGAFVIDTPNSLGAVYRKVQMESGTYMQLEEATGKLFNPTYSPVKLVEIEISIKARKPNIAGY